MPHNLFLGSTDLWVGLLCSLLSAVFFGSGFVLIKKREPRDGIFTQWMMCNGIMLAGFCILLVEDFPRFYPATALGGMIWAVGNSMAIPIFKELSLGPAYLLPDIVNCLGNFLVGYFGLFWTTPRPPKIKWLAFTGLAIIITGGVFIAMVENVKPARKKSSSQPFDKDQPRIFPLSVSELESTPTSLPQHSLRWSKLRSHIRTFRRPLFSALALFVGLFYFLCPTPTIAYIDTSKREGWEAPDNFISYLFSLHSGIYISSTSIFIVYAALRRNRPFATPDLCLPSLLTGFIWSAGLIFWFLSTDKLGQGITGPITAMMPGCVGSLWSVFYFREVKSGRSYYYLVLAIILTLTGAFAIGLSK